MRLREITFLVGNGFDLNCGLKTKYSDIYMDYLAQEPRSNAIRDFQNELKQYLDSDGNPLWARWSDFEMGFASYAKKLPSESNVLECLESFSRSMISHLESEERAFLAMFNPDISHNKEFHEAVVDEVCKSIEIYSLKLPRNNSRVFFEMADIGDYIHYNFIDFNYTYILDAVLEDARKDKRWIDAKMVFRFPIHIHGTLSEGLTLGIDNIEQLSGIRFPISSALKRALIKPFFNSVFDEKRVSSAMDAINNSDVLVVFGLSLGDSDLTWKTAIKEWILQSNDHHLVFFSHKYSEQIGLLSWQKIQSEEDAIYETLLRFEIPKDEIARCSQQVHIPIGENIFNISSIVLKKKAAAFVVRPPFNS